MFKRKTTAIILLSLLTLFISCGASACKKEGEEESNNGAVGGNGAPLKQLEDTSFKGYAFNQVQAENRAVTYTPLNMSTQYMQDLGIYGDGCQWPVSLESSKDGSIMFYGIDVAGMYRSEDHGVTWQKCNTGVVSRGVGMFGIDPKNPSHVIAAGLSGSSAANAGMVISYDGGDSWSYTGFNLKIDGTRYLWDGLEFDPTSYDSQNKICTTAYYSVPFERDREKRANAYALPKKVKPLAEGKQGLYKSVDGGREFLQISDDYRLSDGILKITDNGNILVGNQHGLFRVDADGAILNGWLLNEFSDYANDKITINLSGGGTADILKCYLGITGLDCVGNKIYAQTWDGVYTLDLSSVAAGGACALSPQIISSTNYKSQNWPQFLKVSPSNPQHMVYQYRSRVDKVGWDTYWVNYVDVSFDGGASWTKAEADGKTVFTDGNWAGREKLFSIDPSNDNNVVCLGSDCIMRSADGGLNFVQASGVSNMMCGSKMHFNYFDDDIIMAGAQDYGGTVSVDGGKTFKRLKINGEGFSYGHMYDGFAADYLTYFGFARPSWTGENHLVITRDGGESWQETGISYEYGKPTGTLQSYKNPDVLFAGCYRSADRGRTWNKMQRCVCVSTVSYGPSHELIGYDEDANVIISKDDGASWSVAFDRTSEKFNSTSTNVVGETIRDLAYDHVNRIIYAAVDTHHKSGDNEYNSHAFFKITLDENFNAIERSKLNAHEDSDGYENYSDIEVDPNATNVVYIALAGNYFSNKFALQRSIDGGESWQVLTSNTETEEGKKGLCTNAGGFEASMLAVQPRTGRLFIGCGCYGFEWVTPPYDQLNGSGPATHTVAFVYGGKVVHEEKVKNNRTFDYFYDEDGLTFDGWYEDAALTKRYSGGAIYNSQYLYAKMKKAQQAAFIVDGKVYKTVDIEYGNAVSAPIPKIDGRVFAGWYLDEKLGLKADVKNIKGGDKLYAAFYEAVGEAFDPAERDYSAYIQFSNRRLSSTDRAEAGEECENRCAYIELEKGKEYLLTLKMDARCRYGLYKGEIAANKAPDEYFIYERDINGSDPVDEWVYIKFNSGDCDRMLLFYYTSASGSGLAYTDVRATISCMQITA